MAFDISAYILAGYPCLYVRTTEQERALQEIVHNVEHAGLEEPLNVFVWKVTTGLYPYASDDPISDRIQDTTDLGELMRYISTSDDGWPHKNRLYIVFNPKAFIDNNPFSKQAIRDAAYAIRTKGSHVIFVGAAFECPEELSEVITFIDFDLPTKEEIKTLFSSITDAYKEAMGLDVSEDMLEKAAENATGLTRLKAENAMALSIVGSRGVDINLLRKEKQLAIKQSGVLEYMPTDESFDTLGGFDNLKEHVKRRRRYFEEHRSALDFGLKPPKGVMLVGLAGCGKTLSAKTIATVLNLPLYRLDVGSLFRGIVGSSEQATKETLSLLETVAPACLLIDESEKLLAGLESSGKSDAGTTSRVIGSLLTWFSETKAPIYKIATCNTIRNLDNAMFRKGRWDEVFAVDLPADYEREQIFSIHLRKRGREVTNFDLTRLSAATEGFVGAEIEAVVDEGLYVAFDANQDVTTDILTTVASKMVPISKTDKENIEAFRRWMEGRATPVSSVKAVKAQEAREALGGISRLIRTN